MTEKIFISIDDERIELTGEALDVFLADRAKMQEELQAEQEKLAELAAKRAELLARIGITEEEAKILLG